MFVLDLRRAMTGRIFLGGPTRRMSNICRGNFRWHPEHKINIIYTAETAGN